MVDYSKWRDIEISDDEDDTHPNIDTPSLFRWRHQARMERMAEMEREKEELKKSKESYQANLIKITERIKKKDGVESELQKELEKIKKQGKEIEDKELALSKKERHMPWNVDTISKPGFAKTVLNKQEKKEQKETNLSEEEQQALFEKFIEQNDKLIKKYGMLRKYDDSRRFLEQYPHLACESTANYLVIWCIELAMDEKLELVNHVAHQCICMQYILELAKQFDIDPRACIASFFMKIKDCAPEYRAQFEQEIEDFKKRIKKRAEEKLAKILAEMEEKEKKERLGPGGLDPQEVYESLPEKLQECFESRDVGLLQQALTTMPVEEAKYHMQRCIDSGLWVPNAEDAEKEENKPPIIIEQENGTNTDNQAAAKSSTTTSIEEID